MGGSTTVHPGVNPVVNSATAVPSQWSIAPSTRRRVGLVLAVVGAFTATVVLLSLTSTVVARFG
jgi:hypothetical protein